MPPAHLGGQQPRWSGGNPVVVGVGGVLRGAHGGGPDLADVVDGPHVPRGHPLGHAPKVHADVLLDLEHGAEVVGDVPLVLLLCDGEEVAHRGRRLLPVQAQYQPAQRLPVEADVEEGPVGDFGARQGGGRRFGALALSGGRPRQRAQRGAHCHAGGGGNLQELSSAHYGEVLGGACGGRQALVDCFRVTQRSQ
ncbi:unnamed protein product [Heterosigma akashiwo]